MSKILITGGAGFIGTHLAKRLLQEDQEVVLLDNFSEILYPASLKEARLTHMFSEDERPRLITGDILDVELLETIFSEEKFDKVVHLAAFANALVSLREPEQYTLVNVNGTLNVLQACRRHDVVQFIMAGTSSIYDDKQTPFREDAHPLHPQSAYGTSKLAAELYCQLWHELYQLPVTVLRFFSVYGPWGRPDMAPVIFARQLLADETLKVTPERWRDFTFVEDIVSGVTAALERRFEYEVINLGRGEPVELREMIAVLERTLGKTARIEDRESPPGELQKTYADITRARELLGYEPKVSFEEGFGKLAQWAMDYPEYLKKLA